MSKIIESLIDTTQPIDINNQIKRFYLDSDGTVEIFLNGSPVGTLENRGEILNINQAGSYSFVTSGTPRLFAVSEFDPVNIDAGSSAAQPQDVQQYSAQFLVTGSPVVSIQHWGTFEQRSENILNYFTMSDKTLSNDDYQGSPIWQITSNANGNFFTFPNFGDRRLNIYVHVAIICSSPPFDKGAALHISRGLNGTIVDDRSRTTIFQSFSTINPGAISFDMYTLAQGAGDPYYQVPLGGFGAVLENVSSSNSYVVDKIKLDCVAHLQQEVIP